MTEKRVAEQELEAGAAKKPRLPKRKVALQIGYCGTGYHGMQVNPPHRTIEGDLFDALVKAGAISEDNANDPKKSSFLRAARTDKGVHAAGNVVSLKMIIEDPEIVAKVNAHLPEQIRVWGFTRTNRSFDCRRLCSSRVYEYVLPTYTLMSPSSLSSLGRVMTSQTDRLSNKDAVEVKESDEFWGKVYSDLANSGISIEDAVQARKEDIEGTATEESRATIQKVKQIENKHRRSYRVNAERLNKFREVLKEYQGVHNFHNFTVRKYFKDPSAVRNMKTLTVGDPFVIDGTEWVSVKIHGQSFMLHQIRKMIALAVLIIRTNSPVDVLKGLYEKDKVSIPKAPALGLLLERPVYDAYNLRLGKLGRDHITFEPFEAEIDAFKHKFIYDRIYKQEAQENDFHAFFGYMDTYRLKDILDYLLGVKSEEGNEVPAPESESESDNDEDNEG